MLDNYRAKISGFYENYRRLPTYRELAKLFGFQSKNAAYKLAQKMIDAGLIKKDRSGKLVPLAILSELPLAGVVEAGIPTPAEAALLDTTSLEDLLVEHRGDSFLLKVKGESMIEAGIHDGDLVLADTKREPREGDIVVAEVDGDWTMKYLKTKNGRKYLMPANKNFKPIYPETKLHIAAVVRAVIRKY
jgi:repressor LexA